MQNALAISSVTPANTIDCSYAGGCEITLDSKGLFYILLEESKNYIEVCGTKAEINLVKESPSNLIKFDLPPLATTISNPAFNINIEEEDLKGDKPFGTCVKP